MIVIGRIPAQAKLYGTKPVSYTHLDVYKRQELDSKRLWSMRREVFGSGSLQMLACAALLAPAGVALGADWKTALIAALALSLSSTAIAVQTMDERNLLTTPTGHSAFAILLFQDIAAIPLLAVIPLLATHAAATGTPWLDGLKAIGAVAGVIVIGRYLTRPALRLIAAADTLSLIHI